MSICDTVGEWWSKIKKQPQPEEVRSGDAVRLLDKLAKDHQTAKYYNYLPDPSCTYKVEFGAVYLWKQDEWYYCDIDNNYDFSDSSLWKQVKLWDYEWDKYPTATRYCPIEMRYYIAIPTSQRLFRKLTIPNKNQVFTSEYNILSDQEIKCLIKRPKEEKKVSNMIGKKSGIDWSGAPEDATHVYIGSRSMHRFSTFRKNINFHTQKLQAWRDNEWVDWWVGCPEQYISKEEDLGMNKTINDIEVGMFLKSDTGAIGLVLTNNDNIHMCLVNYSVVGVELSNTITHWTKRELFTKKFSYSYTYDGEYLPFTEVESEKDKKIKELKETINQAKKQMEELEGLK